MTHELKTWPVYFEAVLAGHKQFEVRFNDRNFKVGDFLILEEFDPITQCYTDRRIACLVTFVFSMCVLDQNSKDFVVLGLQL